MLNGLTDDYKPEIRALEAGSKELSSQMVKDFLLGDEQRDEQNERLSAMWTSNNNRRRFIKSRPFYRKKEDDGKQNNHKPDFGWLKCVSAESQVIEGEDTKVCLVQKPIYGLKQA
jgi:hypothetical protein